MTEGPYVYWGGADRKGWGRNSGIINFSVDTRGDTGFRVPKGQPGAGQFTTAQAGFKARNYDLALRVQAQVVENIEERILRPGVSSGRLLKVTADPENRDVDQFGFSVGIEDHLDTSIAKYWRTIEEGSERVWPDVPSGRPSMIGLPLKGFWGGTILGMRGNRVLGGRPLTRHGAGSGGKFIPAKKGKLARKTTVSNPIEPMWAYRDAYEQIDVAQQSRANMAQYLDEVSNIKLPPQVD